MPYYTVFLGGASANRSLTLAKNLGIIPARRVPEFIVALLKQTPLGQKPSTAATQALIQTFAKLPEKPEEILYQDWGMNAALSLAGRGPGECSSGVLDLVLYEIDRAEHLLPKDPAAAFLAAAGAFLPMLGVETHSPQETVKAFHQHLCNPGWVHPDAAAITWPIAAPLPIETITALVQRIRALQQSLDGRRNFTLPRFGGQ
jgi:sulfite reductase (ferredoxin)